jgi:hypothetical protein
MNSAGIVVAVVIVGDNLQRLCNGQLTVKQCAKNIVVLCSSIMAGLYGGERGGKIAKSIVHEIGSLMDDTFVLEIWDVLIQPDFTYAMAALIGTLVGGLTPVAFILFLFDSGTRNLFRGWNRNEENVQKNNNMPLKDAYKFLELDPDATMDEIKSRFKRLALIHHPDKGGSYPNWYRLKTAMTIIERERNIPTYGTCNSI